MLGAIFTGILKPYIAAVMSVAMALTSTLTGPAGEYEKLAVKAMNINPSVTETEISLMINLEAIGEYLGEDASVFEDVPLVEDGKMNLSATIYTYSDSEDMKAVISFSESLEDGYAVYVDQEGIAIAPALVDSVFGLLSIFDASFVETYEVYQKYFDDNGMYFEWDDIFVITEIGEEAQVIIELIGTVVTDVCEIITKEDNLKALADIYAPIMSSFEEYCEEITVDGAKGYTCKINGIQLMEYSSDMLEIIYSVETANKIFDYCLDLLDDVDYIKYLDILKTVSAMFGEDISEEFALPEGLTNEILALLVKDQLEAYRTDFVNSYLSFDISEAVEVLDMIATGEYTEGTQTDAIEVINAVRPFLEASYVEGTIYENNGVITQNEKIVIADQNTVLGELGIATSTAGYTGTLPAAKEVVPFDKRVDFDEIDNKLGYEAAVEKGVHSIEIYWYAEMTPENNELEILMPDFFVMYNTSMIDSIKNDPAFAVLDRETQEIILGMYDESDHESKYCSSSAQLIDSSVYLPLRQIMENAGYEVSWDAEARKAYVTVDGQKIEMTGVIVNDRTYVKIRDFEKLGATVDYQEEFYRQDAYNDFDKSCYVTITFANDGTQAAPTDPTEFSVQGIIESIYNQKAPLFMIGTMPVDMTDEFSYKTYLGLDDVSVIKDAAVSESMIGAQAYSLVVVRVNEGVNAQEIADKMKSGIDTRKWICVEADDVKVAVAGDLICFCMISSEYKDAFTADDAINAFNNVINGNAEYIGSAAE